MKINEVTFKHDLKQLEEEVADLNKASKNTAPELLKAQMPMVRQIEKNLAAYGYEKGTKEYQEAFDVELAYYRKFGFPSTDKYPDRKTPHPNLDSLRLISIMIELNKM